MAVGGDCAITDTLLTSFECDDVLIKATQKAWKKTFIERLFCVLF